MNDYKKTHAEKGPFIAEMKEGERFIGFYILAKKTLESFKDKDRGKFLTLLLRDASGQVISKIWEGGERVYSELNQGQVVKVDGEVSLYQDRIQVKIFNIRQAEDGEYAIQDLRPSGEHEESYLKERLDEYISCVEDQYLIQLLDFFFGDPDFMDLFLQAPAAKKIHHAYIQGLAVHTLEVCDFIVTSFAHYNDKMDKDILFAGVLLHDIGKVKEYQWALDIDFTDQGRLLGHIIIADQMITQEASIIEGFPESLLMELRHMILSHHGTHEYGSAVLPNTIEAMALHCADNLSAQVNRFDTIYNDKANGENWTDYDFLLGRMLYITPKIKKGDEKEYLHK